jgi:hypothetical protein
MFTDGLRRIVWDQIRQQDLKAFAKWLSPEWLTTAAKSAGVRIGRGPLHAVNLAWLAVAAALHRSRPFANVLTLTLKRMEDTDGFTATPLGQKWAKARRRPGPPRRSRHDPRGREGVAVSEANPTPLEQMVCEAGPARLRRRRLVMNGPGAQGRE